MNWKARCLWSDEKGLALERADGRTTLNVGPLNRTLKSGLNGHEKCVIHKNH